MSTERDHGGNLDAAIAQHGGTRADWIDLSTGINPTPYPVPDISPNAWADLPTKSAMNSLRDTARSAYQTRANIIPLAGAQGAIQMIPFLQSPGTAKILGPTYNEHAAALRTGGWHVETVSNLTDLSGADLAVVVNPNNPDGNSYSADHLQRLADNVGILIIDESFADPIQSLSLAPILHDLPLHVILLRSFGKFYGLAGIRLGFALAHGPLAARLTDLAGPWPIPGPAIEIATKAFADTAWKTKTLTQLKQASTRLDTLAAANDWQLVGGTPLFRTYATPNAQRAQTRLAQHRIWSRIFPYSDTWIRLGLPPQNRWDQLEAALTSAQ